MKTVVKLLVCAAMICSVSTASAQYFIPFYIPVQQQAKQPTTWSNNNTRSSIGWSESNSEKMLPWGERQLTWDDFQGKRIKKRSDMAYDINFIDRPFVQKQKISNVKYYYLNNQTFMDSSDSWVNDSCKTASMLQMAQNNFDLWELCSRKAAIEYNSTSCTSFDEVRKFYIEQFNQLSEEMDEATNKGKDLQKVDEYERIIKSELDSLKFEPDKFISTLTEQSGYGMNIGYTTHFPSSDYVGAMDFGMNLGFEFYSKRHLFGLDMSLEGGGECKKSIITKKGVINKGDYMYGGMLLLNYGYNMYNDNKKSITPFVGVGVHFYDGGKKYSEYQSARGDSPVEKAGFSFGLGFNTSLHINHLVQIKSLDEEIQKLTNNINIKPYFSLSNYSGEIGWVPAINVAVTYSFKMSKLDK